MSDDAYKKNIFWMDPKNKPERGKPVLVKIMANKEIWYQVASMTLSGKWMLSYFSEKPLIKLFNEKDCRIIGWREIE